MINQEGSQQPVADKRCATCKHFQWPDIDRKRGSHGICGIMDEITDIIDDPVASHPVDMRPELLARPAYIHAIYEHSYLSVRPDFGCVMHEEGDEDR